MKKVYDDMSVEACALRYEEKRAKIMDNIRFGVVSASMSGIEYYPKAKFHDIENDPIVVEMNLTWDGEKRIQRPNWEKEFEDYKNQLTAQ